MAGGRCGGPFPRPAPGAAEEYPGSRRDVLNAERDGGFLETHIMSSTMSGDSITLNVDSHVTIMGIHLSTDMEKLSYGPYVPPRI